MAAAARIAGSLGACPECGGRRVRRGHSYLRHLVRSLRRSHKRWCRDCGAAWHVVDPPLEPALGPDDYLRLVGLLAAAAAIALAGRPAPQPVHRAKQEIRARYERKYGDEAQRMLWARYGWLYPSKEQARRDYSEHAPRR